MWWILAVVWAVGALLAFGFAKGFWKVYHEREGMKWDREFTSSIRLSVLLGTLTGPVGLVGVLAANFSIDREIARKFSFCLWIPKELCAKEE